MLHPVSRECVADGGNSVTKVGHTFYNSSMQSESFPSHFSAHVEPGAQAFEASTGQTLLASMEQAGITWPSSCRNGTCRTCIGQLTQGTVRYEIEWPGLSLEEKASHHVLPCVAFATMPLTLNRLD